jgi:hypothetical protein
MPSRKVIVQRQQRLDALREAARMCRRTELQSTRAHENAIGTEPVVDPSVHSLDARVPRCHPRGFHFGNRPTSA